MASPKEVFATGRNSRSVDTPTVDLVAFRPMPTPLEKTDGPSVEGDRGVIERDKTRRKTASFRGGRARTGSFRGTSYRFSFGPSRFPL
jgi:hypothetical protein